MKEKFSEEKLWELLETKSFSQLNEEEREGISAFISENEYKRIHTLKNRINKNNMLIPPDLKLREGQGKEIFEAGKQKRKSLIKKVAMYQISAWKAVAAAVFLAGTFYIWGLSSASDQINIRQSVLTKDSLTGISLAEDSSLSKFMIEAF